MDETITVETDMFEHRAVMPHFINPCCFGEDFAAWLKQELALLTGPGFDLSEIIQEDYGGLGFAWQGSLLDRLFLRWGWASGSACTVGHLCHLRSRTQLNQAFVS